MKLKIAETDVHNPQKVKDFIQESQGFEMKTVDGNIVEIDGEGEWTQGELFATGYDMGKRDEYERWTKPESFQIHKKFAAKLREAIEEYQEKTLIEVDSIKISEPDGMEYCTISIQPTQAIHFFGVVTAYGKKCVE